MGPRRRASAVLHGLGGALSLLGLLTITVAVRAEVGWAAVGVGVGMAGLGIGIELLAQRFAPPRDAAALAASRRHGALGRGLALAAVPLFLGVILLTGQFGTTRQFLDTAVTAPGASCCRGDLAFPLGGLFAAWGLAIGLAAALPVRDTATRFGPTEGARVGWALGGAAAALPVVVLVQLADWQAGSALAVALATALPPALVVAAATVLGFRRRLVVAVGGVSRHTGPVRRDPPALQRPGQLPRAR